MALKEDRSVTVRAYLRMADVFGSAPDLGIVLHEYAVVQDSDARRVKIASILIENRGGVDDVIDVPLAGFAHGVHERRSLFVDGSGLTVYVCLISVAVHYLDLILTLEIDTAVPP